MAIDRTRGGVHGRRPSFRGRGYSRVSNGVEVFQSWPKARGKKLHPKTKEQMEFFRQVQWAFKYSDAEIQRLFTETVKGTPLLPRDLFLMAVSGRMFSFETVDGQMIHSTAVLNDLKRFLEWLFRRRRPIIVPGDDDWVIIPPSTPEEPAPIIVPDGDGWGTIPQPQPGEVVVWDPSTGQWVVVPISSLTGGGMNYSFPAQAENSFSTATWATFANKITLADDILVDQLLICFNAAAVGEERSAFIATSSGGGSITGTIQTADARHTSVATGYQQAVFEFDPPVLLQKGQTVLLCLVRTDGGPTTPARIAGGNTNAVYTNVPLDTGVELAVDGSRGRRYFYSNNSDAPSSVTPANSAAGNYLIGMRWTFPEVEE